MLETDEQGQVTHEFAVPRKVVGLSQFPFDGRLQVFAILTDSAGQSHTAVAEAIVSTRPLKVELHPEGGSLVRGITNNVYVQTSYLDGSPAACRVEIEPLESRVGE